MPFPSGLQFELVHGPWHADVTEVGATLRTLRYGQADVVASFARHSMCWGGHGQPLLPWPNRIDHGAYVFEGQAQVLALSEPAHLNAIHGLTRFLPWSLRRHDPAHCTMALRLHPQPGYPFTVDFEVGYALTDDGLAVETEATNRGPTACPYGAGYHPYLTAGDAHIDSSTLLLPATTVLLSDARGIPTGERVAVTRDGLDFRRPRRIAATRLDTCFTDLARDARGYSVVELSSADGARTVSLWMDESFDHVMLFSGDPFGEDQRRRALAVEPMTCPPNAFATGAAAILQPGARHRTRWGISARGR